MPFVRVIIWEGSMSFERVVIGAVLFRLNESLYVRVPHKINEVLSLRVV